MHDDSLSITETINVAFAEPVLQLTNQEQSAIIHSLENSTENTFAIVFSDPFQSETPLNNETPFRKPHSKPLLRENDFQWKPLQSIEEIKDAHFCGQVFDSFLLFESTARLFLIDQVFFVRTTHV